MTKSDFLQNLYATKVDKAAVTIVYNDTRNFCFIEYVCTDMKLYNEVFCQPDPYWCAVRALIRMIREHGQRTQVLKAPWSYPIAR